MKGEKTESRDIGNLFNDFDYKREKLGFDEELEKEYFSRWKNEHLTVSEIKGIEERVKYTKK